MRILEFAAVIVAGVVALGVAAYAYFLYSPDPTPPLSVGRCRQPRYKSAPDCGAMSSIFPRSFLQARHL
jgi:hypothetical protein